MVIGVSHEVEKAYRNNIDQLVLYAPWRGKNYLDKKPLKKKICPFCVEIQQYQDEKNLILFRGKHAVVMLNLYPYTKGHLLVIPYAHVDSLDKLSVNERSELFELVNKSIQVLNMSLAPVGFNAGINIGKIAGASIPGHIHIHVLPRFNYDNAFIQLVGNTRLVSWDLSEMYVMLFPYFNNLIN